MREGALHRAVYRTHRRSRLATCTCATYYTCMLSACRSLGIAYTPPSTSLHSSLVASASLAASPASTAGRYAAAAAASAVTAATTVDVDSTSRQYAPCSVSGGAGYGSGAGGAVPAYTGARLHTAYQHAHHRTVACDAS
jgi:hypothetical protein